MDSPYFWEYSAFKTIKYQGKNKYGVKEINMSEWSACIAYLCNPLGQSKVRKRNLIISLQSALAIDFGGAIIGHIIGGGNPYRIFYDLIFIVDCTCSEIKEQ